MNKLEEILEFILTPIGVVGIVSSVMIAILSALV